MFAGHELVRACCRASIASSNQGAGEAAVKPNNHSAAQDLAQQLALPSAQPAPPEVPELTCAGRFNDDKIPAEGVAKRQKVA